ncbi:hypothetical protein CDL12_28683 [Handroanthus impetiginosus]|uniref:HAT C-terminal dimerisation domain-containing protein n=1 Tax=Handroanthus impetiginosus TaxID=429701 RepID=A0A2G9G0J9_9LAMI|nr:hypothetical protein CDL12_28683 [Handroanthus impetiginosus]
MFSSIIEVLEIIKEDGINSEQSAEAHSLLCSMQSFEFIFNLHLMRKVLGNTHELSQALQRDDQDIVNAMSLVKKKLVQLANLYSCDFSFIELLALDTQLKNYILDLRSDSDFDELTSIGELSKKLPVATATMERTFSAMSIIKNKLRNRMGDECLNDYLITYLERDVFDAIENEKIVQ